MRIWRSRRRVSLNETTWTYTDMEGRKVEELIDAAGNYITTSGAEHVDHGTYVAKDGKACFTSAMDKEGESAGPWPTHRSANPRKRPTTRARN